jgi:hypothetical protein
MKKTLYVLTILAVILVLSVSVSAQTESKGDTLLVGPLNSEGAAIGALNEAIHGDTTATGERAHKVYKLQRGAQYILTEVINADFPLIIVADAPDAENRPPIIRNGLNEEGATVNLWWRLFDHATFKNLWISGINMDGTGPINWISQEVNTSGKTISYEGCIVEFPYTWWAIFADWGGGNNYKLTDNIFMNIGNPTGTTWNGAVFHGMNIDSAIIRNNTFFNFGAFAVNGNQGSYYGEIDHNSFVNSVVHPHSNHGWVKQIWTNNLYVNGHAFSDDPDEIKRHFDQEVKGLMNYAEIQWDPQALDSLYGPGGVYGKSYDPNGDGELTEEELVWVLRNNAYWYTQPIIDYWDSFEEVVYNPWMNNYNKAMFENQDGPWSWEIWTNFEFDSNGVAIDSQLVKMEHNPFEFFVEENTMNEDPGLVEIRGTDVLLAQNCINIRREWAGEEVPDTDKVKWHNVDDYLAFTWPLDFDLSYSNAALQSGSTGGKPVGSLQWWDAEYTSVGGKNNAVPVDFSLKQNYPNPFNPVTSINYQIHQAGKVELKVYNVLGAEVATLVEGNQQTGNYTVSFDGSNLASGVYFYKLTNGNNTVTKKMMLMK